MAEHPTPLHITGVGTHRIELEILDPAVRERLMECVRANGKISIMVERGVAVGEREGGFAQQVD